MPGAAKNKIRILFICLGNICRSPMAEGIMARMIKDSGLAKYISVASCGIGNWAMGHAPDKRAILAAAEKGADIQGHSKALLGPQELIRYDYFIAMDGENFYHTMELAKWSQVIDLESFQEKIFLMRDFEPDMNFRGLPVPDPYEGTLEDFREVAGILERCCKGLLSEIIDKYGLGKNNS